ncbi:type VII secretion protein EccB [Phytohabitans rumicis]|uniref:Type VII secretion protein EccB n=1 Tax=Phytohabitans rumicis TaxID=1076125 RepID=A0A6V8L554_9ACTN|nr:type VII secretion protein EccB [Phytohabitans rumicis]GFJ90118.1 hypothetical protein Prum_037600 [Phytohabitans rumicis]
MSSRQDQLHSYQFMVQRVVAALVMRDADPGRSPFRRAAGAALASVVVAAIGIGGAAIYGTVAGAGTPDWRDGRSVLVEKESGARYVYRDGALHPVPNHVSALLIVGPGAQTVLVSGRSIEGEPRGVPLGIADAPDALPDARRLTTAAWQVCSTSDARWAVLVGARATGAALADRAVLARHPEGALHLIWQARRHLLRDRDLVLAALGWTGERPLPVAAALLDALPAGPDLARVAGPVGEVFVVASQGGGRQYAVAVDGGLAPITQVQADLLLTDLDQAAPTPLSQGAFADRPKVASPFPAGLPATTPVLAAAGPVCGEVRDDSGVAEVRVEATVPRAGVTVEPGRAALVEAGAVHIVTDRGRRHAMSDREVPALLGYADVRPLRVPRAVLELVPAGATLDPSAARSPA